MTNFEEIFEGTINTEKFKEVNPICLAFIGDAVHTLFVRDNVVKTNSLLLKDYHKKSASMCKASCQADLLDKMFDNLFPDEQDIVRRARNTKTNTKAKNSDLETYKKATSYEALIGYLYLKGDYSRLKEILKG